MTSNLLLVLGPLAGLSVARVFGPWRSLSALAASALGQLVVFYGYILWQRVELTRPIVGSAGTGRMVVSITPTLGGRLMVVGMLFVIAAIVAALALGIQALASRLAGGPPPAV
jgi:hypothetical protein